MNFISVIQHTRSEWLGTMEDHLEGRGIGFGYFRPFVAGGKLPDVATLGDGLILVGGGPWGTTGSSHRLPTLEQEIRITRACLMLGKPVVAIGLGAQILSMAAEGSVSSNPLTFEIFELERCINDALGGFLPARIPAAVYMRGWPAPPNYANILAVDPAGRPAIFQIGCNAFGFVAHPGIRRSMIEDLIMEFEEIPNNSANKLQQLSQAQTQIEDALVSIMTGLVSATNWMSSQP